jgi:hypothetical protein
MFLPPEEQTRAENAVAKCGQLASTEAMLNGYDNATILNRAGHVAEGPGACIFLVRDGVVSTPDLTSGILESITSDAFITFLRGSLGIEVRERVVDRTELYLADEVLLAGTGVEVTPVTLVDRLRPNRCGHTSPPKMPILPRILPRGKSSQSTIAARPCAHPRGALRERPRDQSPIAGGDRAARRIQPIPSSTGRGLTWAMAHVTTAACY